MLGTSLAGPQAPPCSGPPRPGSGERPPRGHVPPSARTGECERQRGSQVSPRRLAGVGAGLREAPLGCGLEALRDGDAGGGVGRDA